MCKKCRKAFRKDMSAYEESDEFCPHCDNHYVSLLSSERWMNSSERSSQVIEAKIPQAVLSVETDDVRKDAR